VEGDAVEGDAVEGDAVAGDAVAGDEFALRRELPTLPENRVNTTAERHPRWARNAVVESPDLNVSCGPCPSFPFNLFKGSPVA
jgi:hypothetical protein